MVVVVRQAGAAVPSCLSSVRSKERGAREMIAVVWHEGWQVLAVDSFGSSGRDLLLQAFVGRQTRTRRAGFCRCLAGLWRRRSSSWPLAPGVLVNRHGLLQARSGEHRSIGPSPHHASPVRPRPSTRPRLPHRVLVYGQCRRFAPDAPVAGRRAQFGRLSRHLIAGDLADRARRSAA